MSKLPILFAAPSGNMKGRVSTLASYPLEPTNAWITSPTRLERLPEAVACARVTGRLDARARFTLCEITGGLHFRADSHAHPEFWIEFSLQTLPSPFGSPVSVKGRTSNGPSSIFLSVLGDEERHVLRFDDAQHPAFWAETPLPVTYNAFLKP